MPREIDLKGQEFGFLTVLSKASNHLTYTRWLCKCICGVEVIAQTRHLRGGEVKSCGCKSNEMRSVNSGNASHRMSGTPTYKTWQMMHQRCKNPTYDKYDYYGGRGISICERWNCFENFLEDMGERPEGLTLDRIDTDGNYEKSNCRWATIDEQLENRKNTVFLLVNDVVMSLKQLANFIGVTRERLYNYIYRGYTPQEAVAKLSSNPITVIPIV
jgi:hypothetical protein